LSLAPLLVVLALTQPIPNIEVEGNTRVTDDAILGHAGVSTVNDIADAFKRLWGTGLFDDVRFDLAAGTLVIHVVEKPLLRAYRFEGERLPEDELVRGLGLRPNQPFGEGERRTVEKITRELLGDSVDVETTTEIADGRVSLVVKVVPTETRTIERIRFIGNEALTDNELRDAMQSKQKGWTTWITGSDELNASVLAEDSERLRSLYGSHGFLDARVGPIETEPVVTVPVFEGRRYTLDALTVEPGLLLTEEIVSEWMPEAGGVCDESEIDALAARLERYYQNRGYPSVTVIRERNVTAPGHVAIHLRVDTGALLRVGTITFRGNRRHRDRDLRQHLDLDESERFNQALLERGVQSLVRLETLADVIPEIDLSSRAGRADVIYHVREVDRFEYLVGGGINGIEGGSGNAQFIAKSLLGRGDVWRLDLDVGNRLQNVVGSYRDPSTLGRRLFLGVDFARTNLTYTDETSEDTLDVALRVGGPQGRSWQILGGFRITHFTLGTDLDETVAFLTPYLGERFRTNRASVTLAYDGRNQPVFPIRGTGAQLGVELVTGDVEAMRARAQIAQLVQLSARHVLSFSGRVEAVWPFGETNLDGLPRFERLFLGTENDMRGFAIRGVGPRDADVTVGGDRLAYGAAEYQFVAHPRLRLVGFFDIGNVWATDFEGLSLPDLRYDAGAEIQLLTPVWNLPFRIGYGVNLDPVLAERDGRSFVTLAVRF
jgi:outer membrane protein insertion porin family